MNKKQDKKTIGKTLIEYCETPDGKICITGIKGAATETDIHQEYGGMYSIDFPKYYYYAESQTLKVDFDKRNNYTISIGGLHGPDVFSREDFNTIVHAMRVAGERLGRIRKHHKTVETKTIII